MSIKEFFVENLKGIKAPESFRDIHLLIFFLQVIIFLLCSLGFYNIAAIDKPEILDGGAVHSYISAFHNEEADKTFCKLPNLFDEDEEHVVHTDKFLDLEQGGLWLSDKQKALAVSFWFSFIPAPIIYLLLGLGNFYAALRTPYFDALRNTAGLMLVPPVGVAVWGSSRSFSGWAYVS
ncbi:MAG TPA: hypothetical protein DCG49_00645 [Ruminococcus sp.]|nr:hypothetical protein [Ruminococcus sp.]